MNSSSTLASSLFQFKLTPPKPTQPSLLRFAPPHSHNALKVSASTNHHSILQTAKQYTKAAIVIATLFHHSSKLLARADPPPPVTFTDEQQSEAPTQLQDDSKASPLPDFLGSNSDAADALKSLLQQKLEAGEDEEAVKILQRRSRP